MKTVFAVIGGGVLFVFLIVGLTEFGYRLDQHYAPREEQVRHDTFEQSQTYNEGVARDIANLRMEYQNPSTTQAQKDNIRDTVRERYGAYDPSKLSPANAAFLTQMIN
jgi:hypothetical protein